MLWGIKGVNRGGIVICDGETVLRRGIGFARVWAFTGEGGAYETGASSTGRKIIAEVERLCFWGVEARKTCIGRKGRVAVRNVLLVVC